MPGGGGGAAFPDFTGGLGPDDGGNGGFGGGGGGYGTCGGGGGGYSGGGGAGPITHFGCNGGGAGGSFDIGTNQILIASFQTGNGEVVITELAAAVPEPASIASLASGSPASSSCGGEAAAGVGLGPVTVPPRHVKSPVLFEDGGERVLPRQPSSPSIGKIARRPRGASRTRSLWWRRR